LLSLLLSPAIEPFHSISLTASLSKLQLPAEKRNISWLVSACVYVCARGHSLSAALNSSAHTAQRHISARAAPGIGRHFCCRARACHVNPLALCSRIFGEINFYFATAFAPREQVRGCRACRCHSLARH